MSAQHRSITSLDDRVARMSDLRTLVDEIAKLIALQQAQIDEIRAIVSPAVPPEPVTWEVAQSNVSVDKRGVVSLVDESAPVTAP